MALVALSREQLTVAGSVVGFTSAKIPPNVVMALVYVTTAPIRYYANGDATTAVGRAGNGTAPTSTLGIPAGIDAVFEVWGWNDIKNWRGIRTTGTSAILEVEFFGDAPNP